jgi:hypothetical protein
MSDPVWAIAYHANSQGKRAKRWYRITRLIYADDAWFELYWHPDCNLRSGNVAELRWLAPELTLVPGVFHQKKGGRANEMERTQ